MEPHYLTFILLNQYECFLQSEERAPATICKYMRDLRRFCCIQRGAAVTKESIIHYKNTLLGTHAASSVNSMLAAINSLLAFLGWHECRVRPVRIQRALYRNSQQELSQKEYDRLLEAAKTQGKERLYYLLQTICSTGIRVSELRFITVQAAQQGRVEVRNKGKSRIVFLPKLLCSKLKLYCRRARINKGSIFITRTGQPLNRSNIWAMMKALCRRAQVSPEKVFPHNLRHLFALTFYRKERDLDHLAAILGHSNINTTRIYSMSSGTDCQRQIELLRLVL